jgi:GT2 family glycosyltransferase
MLRGRPPREPLWLPVDRDRRFGGRWVELTFSASFLLDPVRPTLRFVLPGGGVEHVILPAPVCGRALWRGRFPPGADVFIDPGPGIPADRFRIDPIRVLPMTALAARTARSPRAGLMGLMQHAAGKREGGRRRLAMALHDEPLEAYDAWRRARRREPEPAGLDRLTDALAAAPPLRLIGHAAADRGWRETVKSLQAQLCQRWELVLSARDDAEARTLKASPPFAAEARLAVVSGIAPPCEGAIGMLEIDPGDRLAPEAVAAIVNAFLRHPDAAEIAFDEDEPGVAVRSRRPLFNWPRPLGGKVRAARRTAAPSGAAAVSHYLARVLLYRATPAPRPARPAPPPALGEAWPAVDVIVPTRDRPDMLMRCMASLLDRTRYARLNVIIADNDSVDPVARRYLDKLPAHDARVSVIKVPGAFNFAAICNAAAGRGHGELLVFLNNDVEALNPNWLEALAAAAMQPGTGAVGAKLYYPAGAVQHAGIVLGLHGAAGHFYRGAARHDHGYRDMLASPHHVAAVTGACLAVRRSLFEAVGGFDEAAFAVEFNDIDLCLRLNAEGHATVWTPDAQLVHFESATRGRPSIVGVARHAEERQRFLRRWGEAVANDPWFHPAFSLASESPCLA